MHALQGGYASLFICMLAGTDLARYTSPPCGPVAQLVRAGDSKSLGPRFESERAHSSIESRPPPIRSVRASERRRLITSLYSKPSCVTAQPRNLRGRKRKGRQAIPDDHISGRAFSDEDVSY